MRAIHPVWGVLSDQIKNLCRREDGILAEMRAIQKKQARSNAVNFQAPAHDTIVPAKPKPSLSARALALLGDYAPAPEQPIDQTPRIVQVRPGDEELSALGKDLAAIQEAKAVLHPLLSAAHAEGSLKLCAFLLPEYRAVTGNLCDALIALGGAYLAHKAFTQTLVDQGADWYHFRPIDINTLAAMIGDPADRQSRLRILLASASEGGHFDPQSVPKEWTLPPDGKPNVDTAPAGRRVAGNVRGASTPTADTTPPAIETKQPGGMLGTISNAMRSLTGGG